MIYQDLSSIALKNKIIAEAIDWMIIDSSQTLVKPSSLSNTRHQVIFKPTYSIFDLSFHITYDWLMHAVDYIESVKNFSIRIQDQKVEVRSTDSSEFFDYVEKADGFANKFDILHESIYRLGKWLHNNKGKEIGHRLPYNRSKLGFYSLEKSAEDFKQLILEENSEILKFETIQEYSTVEFKTQYLGIGDYTKSKSNIINLKVEPGQWLAEYKIHKEKLKLIGNNEKEITYVNRLSLTNSAFKDQEANITLKYVQAVIVEDILAICSWNSFGRDSVFTNTSSFEEGPDNLVWMEELEKSLGHSPYTVIKSQILAIRNIWGEATSSIYIGTDPKSGNIVRLTIELSK